ncbi:MAG: hypothetical protein R3B70_04220 [Polyangiaceae bacterium]
MPRSPREATRPLAPSPRRARGALSLAGGAAALLAALLAPAPEAHAFERQWHLGAGAGYTAYIDPSGVALHGAGGALHLTYGISDTLNVLAIADFSAHAPGTTSEGAPVSGLMLAGASGGLAYVFDILQWVPWVGATLGGYYAFDNPSPGGRLALSVPFGLDYQISRSFAVGASGQYSLFFLDPGGVGQRFGGFIRAEYIWGY